MLALSIVMPHGTNIASGRKTLEIRSWTPPHLLLRNLPIIENSIFLREEGASDPNGIAVALVDVEEVHAWQPAEVAAACFAQWVAGYWAWSLSNVRPIPGSVRVAAHRKLYDLPISAQALGCAA